MARVIIVAHRSEMGTGIRTALPMMVADELEADWKRVKIEQALGDKKYGNQNTDGSNSIRRFLRSDARGRRDGAHDAGAAPRLASGACRPRNAERSNHEVIHAKPTASSDIGELATLAAQQPVPKKEELEVQVSGEYRYIGKNVPIADLDDILVRPSGRSGWMRGCLAWSTRPSSVRRCSAASSRAWTTRDAHKVRGRFADADRSIRSSRRYGFQPLGGVAVIADNTWAAMQGRKKLKIDWDLGAERQLTIRRRIKKMLQETAREAVQGGAQRRRRGCRVRARRPRSHEAEYYVPHLAHASMEPPAAVAEFKNGKVRPGRATQNPQAVQDTVAQAVGIKPEDVTCHVTLLGGAFGRKSKPDYVAEAAILSKKLGKPVKVVWTREDDIRFDYFHSVAAMYLKAATDAKGPDGLVAAQRFSAHFLDLRFENRRTAISKWAWAGTICR